MIRRWAEVACDACGCASHYPLGDVKKSAREDGWIITADGKTLCSKECLKKLKSKQTKQ